MRVVADFGRFFVPLRNGRGPVRESSILVEELRRLLRVIFDSEQISQIVVLVLSLLSCLADDADGLLSLSTERVLELAATLEASAIADPTASAMSFAPVADGTTLPRRAIESVAAGSAAGVAVLVGSAEDEWTLLSLMDPTLPNIDDAGVVSRNAARFGEATARNLFDRYRRVRSARGAPSAAWDIFNALETDRFFRIPALRLAEAQRAHSPQVYSYLFNWRSPALDGKLGACHALELPFLFGVHNASPEMRAFSGTGPAADALATAVQDAWLAFARTGDPSCGSVGTVPAYDTERRATLVLGEKCGVQDAPHEADRAIWDGVADELLGG